MASSGILSVVMPTRNQARFIREAVGSVLAQAHSLSGIKLELVVADGKSTDGTVEILQALASAHPDVIRWTSEGDVGPADAVNKAISRARGHVLGWLNSDDLYTPDAAARALRVFDARPDLVMVYGEGDHVDVNGRFLDRYPTRGPDTPLSAWADGCPICQPTAFFRREAFDDLGGLDTTLRTAFDYEFWLRLFKGYPGRVGFVPEVQAHSRLHDEGITLRMREQVAMEGLEVVHRHLGAAPAHWLLTYAGEALRACPFEMDVSALRQRLQALSERAEPWLVPGGAAELRRQLREHRGLQLARADFVADVYADGWAPPALAIRLRQGDPAYQRLRLWGRHAAPGGGPLHLTLRRHGGEPLWSGGSSRPGRFDVSIPLPRETAGQDLELTLESASSFVPARVQPGSGDQRALAFQLEAVELR